MAEESDTAGRPPLNVEDILRENSNEQSKHGKTTDEASSDSDEANLDLLKDILKNRDVRGRRAGSRVWKEGRKRLVISSIERSKEQKKLRYDERMKLKKEIKAARELSQTILDAKAEAKRLRKERREENIKNREKNAKKAEVVQVITNTARLKKIKNRKQLSSIEKRDTTGMV